MPAVTEALVTPRRSSVLGLPHSTIQLVTLPSASFTSMWIQAWGLIHSILVTVPRSFTGLLPSNSAVNAWCAHKGAARKLMVKMMLRMASLLNLFGLRGCGFLLRAFAGKNPEHSVVALVTGVFVDGFCALGQRR